MIAYRAKSGSHEKSGRDRRNDVNDDADEVSFTAGGRLLPGDCCAFKIYVAINVLIVREIAYFI